MNTIQRGGTLLGMALGLLIGVLLSLGVVWYLNKTPLPFVEKLSNPKPRENSDDVAGPVPLPGKPGDPPIGSERKFEFYDILEGRKPAVSGASTVQPESATAQVVGDTYLQVGAFQNRADADQLKGRLAMLGVEAGVLVGEVADKGTLYRVRVGPFANPEAMNRARAQLSQQGIPATVVRARD